jgi:hypothetical protein
MKRCIVLIATLLTLPSAATTLGYTGEDGIVLGYPYTVQIYKSGATCVIADGDNSAKAIFTDSGSTMDLSIGALTLATPLTDANISDTVTIDATGSVAAAAVGTGLTDAQISDTISVGASGSVNVDALPTKIHDIEGLAATDSNFIVGNGTTWVAESGATLLTSAGAQPVDSDLTAIGALSSADGNFIVGSAGGWVAESGATARTSAGLGTGDSPNFTGLSLGADDTTASLITMYANNNATGASIGMYNGANEDTYQNAWTVWADGDFKISGSAGGVFSIDDQTYAVTMPGKLMTVASAAVAGAGLNVPPGVAPDSPGNGDMWSTSTGFYGRYDGATHLFAVADVGAFTTFSVTGEGHIGTTSGGLTVGSVANAGDHADDGEIIAGIADAGAYNVQGVTGYFSGGLVAPSPGHWGETAPNGVWANELYARDDTSLGTDVVTDGTCEADPSTVWINYYSPTANERSNTQAHGGTYSRKVATDSANDGVSQVVAVAGAGKRWSVDFWYYAENAISLRWAVQGAGSAATIVGNGAWQHVTAITSVTGVTDAKFSVYYPTAAATTFYIDDVVIKPVGGDLRVNGTIGVGGAATFNAGTLTLATAYPSASDRLLGSGTNAIVPVSRVIAQTTGDMADGYGPEIVGEATDSGAANKVLGGIGFVRDSADTEGKVVLYGGTNGIEAIGSIDHVGQFNTLDYVKMSGMYTLGIGYEAGKYAGEDTEGGNTFVGYQCGRSVLVAGMNPQYSFNTGVGHLALYSNTTGDSLVAVGHRALYANTTGSYNVAVGFVALQKNTTGYENVAIGPNTSNENTEGIFNVAICANALRSNVTGDYNLATGYNTLYFATGDNNTAYGTRALYTASGSGNVGLGFSAGKYETGSDAFYVDNQDRTNTAGDKAGALLYGVFNATPASQTLTTNSTFTVAQALNVTGESHLGAADQGAYDISTDSIYATGDISALTFTDRASAYKGKDALAEVLAVDNTDDDKFHASLPESVKRPVYSEKTVTDPYTGNTSTMTVTEAGWDLGGMVAVLTASTQQLKAENDELRARIEALEKNGSVKENKSGTMTGVVTGLALLGIGAAVGVKSRAKKCQKRNIN